MGTVLKILGVIFLLLVIGFVALLFWAHGEGEDQQQRFFDAVATNDPAKLMAMMSPELASEFDPPILKLWMKAVNENLGAYQGVSATDFSTNTESTDKGQLTETKGEVEFEKGKAQVRLTLIDDKLVGFEVEADALKGVEWFTQPEPDLYQQRAKAFIENLVALEVDKAYEAMHPGLQKNITQEQLQAGMGRFVQKYGFLKEVEFVGEEFSKSDGKVNLIVRMVCTCEKAKLNAFVRFTFLGMKGHLIEFALPSD